MVRGLHRTTCLRLVLCCQCRAAWQPCPALPCVTSERNALFSTAAAVEGFALLFQLADPGSKVYLKAADAEAAQAEADAAAQAGADAQTEEAAANAPGSSYWSDGSASDGSSTEPPADPPAVSTGSDAGSGTSPYTDPVNDSSTTAGLPGGGTGQGPPPKGGSSVNVGAIVGGVIAANGEPPSTPVCSRQ